MGFSVVILDLDLREEIMGCIYTTLTTKAGHCSSVQPGTEVSSDADTDDLWLSEQYGH